MKNKIYTCMVALICTFSLLAASTNAEARHCKWVPGHWHHGHWVPEHKVCWGGHQHCKWVGGHWRHGHWVPAHKVCWY